MIFVILGSQKFKFNRLLQYIDDLIIEDVIDEEVFAQVGYSDYIPKHYHFCKFLEREEFLNKINESTSVISHAGTGAIISALKSKKKCISIPRLLEFEEHVDDHQMEIAKIFSDLGYIFQATNLMELKEGIYLAKENEFQQFTSNNSEYITFLSEQVIEKIKK